MRRWKIGMVALALSAASSMACAQLKASDDHDFVRNIVADSQAEVQLGNLAETHAASADVKQFGRKMVADHGKAIEELQKISSTKGISLPTELDSHHKSTLDRLNKLSGEEFDRAYADDMVKGHKDAVAALEKESKDGKDPEIKAWAAMTLPTIQDHLRMAQETDRSVDTGDRSSR